MVNIQILKGANTIKDDEFDKLKADLFLAVTKNFNPTQIDDPNTYYEFYVDKKHWVFRYDKGISCWMFIVDGEVVLNKFDGKSGEYITEKGYLMNFDTWQKPTRLASDFRCEMTNAIDTMNRIKSEQQSGTRVIDFPKCRRIGKISRKDYWAGIDDKTNEWSLAFTENDIPFLDKTPIVAPLTLREYFRLCHIYYKSRESDREENCIKNVPVNTKDAYMRFSDKRTEDMEKVDLDDPQDFYDWSRRQGRWKERNQGGHPFEICGKTYLFPRYTDKQSGYYEWRSFIWTSHEAITLNREPNVALTDKDYILKVIKGEDWLEVTPDRNPYGYPNDEFTEYVQYENLAPKQKRKIIWNELLESKPK